MKRLNVIIMAILIFVLAASVFLFLARVKGKNLAKTQTASEELLLKRAQDLEAKGNFLKAKDAYQAVIKECPQGRFAMENQKVLWDINMKVLFSPIQSHDSKMYEVQSQDTLGRIAKKFGTTVELIMKANSLKSDIIRPGMRLKISTAKFSILVDKSQNTLTLKSNDEIFKVYQVATGLDNSTPIGVFKITTKIIDPAWYKAGAVVPPGSPKNILGTRWLGLSIQGYGIHGTTEPESIGKQTTAGCVRMLNKDVEELYIIVPVGTEVALVD